MGKKVSQLLLLLSDSQRQVICNFIVSHFTLRTFPNLDTGFWLNTQTHQYLMPLGARQTFHTITLTEGCYSDPQNVFIRTLDLTWALYEKTSVE